MNKTGTKAILLMGGSGQRFSSDTPKQFHRLFGKKIYLHTLEALIASDLFEEIVLVTAPEWVEEVKAEIAHYSGPQLTLVEGGATRQASSFAGLLACGRETEIVLIHDAVRPFVSQQILEDNVRAAWQFHAVDTCIPSADTLVCTPDQKQIASIPAREQLLRGQTPQTFSYPLILQAHRQASGKHSSDDCALVLALGHSVHIVVGSESNIKITSPLDLILAEQIGRLQYTALPRHACTPLQHKRFVITGGTGGIGRAIVQRLEQEGAIAIPLSTSAAEFPTDLTSFSAVEAAFQKIHARYGPIDGLINCVGLLKIRPFHALSIEEVDQLLATNLMSVVYSCKAAQLHPGAHIVNLASSSYTRGRKHYALYSSAKAAIVNFTQALAEELPCLSINVIVPQRTLTPMRQNNFPNEDPASLLTPAEVAEEILLLLQQSEITGSVIEVRLNRLWSCG